MAGDINVSLLFPPCWGYWCQLLLEK